MLTTVVIDEALGDLSMLLQIAEVFGNDTAVRRTEDDRRRPYCPFQGRACTKQNKHNPLGVCSYSDGRMATIVCPARFREQDHLFHDAGTAAFGVGKRIVAIPEVRILEIPEKKRKIGKVDYLLGLLSGSDEIIDFAAVEVQAVYVSGESRKPFEHFLRTGGNHKDAMRRPDFRSSAQKRLMPQLSLKVPVFRRWGKRFFVAVDSTFFAQMPTLKDVNESNAEITWLAYPFQHAKSGYSMGRVVMHHTLWDDVLTALREGEAPTKEEILTDLTGAMKRRRGHIIET